MGTLDLPGGFVDNNENAEQGMVREILEETGLTIDSADVTYLFSIPNVYHYSGMEHPLEKEMATHSSIPAWKTLWTEEPSGPQSMGLQRVRHK